MISNTPSACQSNCTEFGHRVLIVEVLRTPRHHPHHGQGFGVFRVDRRQTRVLVHEVRALSTDAAELEDLVLMVGIERPGERVDREPRPFREVERVRDARVFEIAFDAWRKGGVHLAFDLLARTVWRRGDRRWT